MKPLAELYCDGACVHEPDGSQTGGWATKLVLNGNAQEIRFGHKIQTSSNEMELRAIFEGLKDIPDEAWAFVYSDSQWAIASLIGAYNAKAYRSLRTRCLGEASRFRHISWCWVRRTGTTRHQKDVDAQSRFIAKARSVGAI